MDNFCYVVGILLAISATIVVAFPDNLIPGIGPKKKRVGARQWGRYHSSKTVDESEEPTIEVNTPARKLKEIAGSQTYAAGRGVRMG